MEREPAASMPQRQRTGQDGSWYELLELSRDAPESDIASAIERLSRQASVLANTAPERSQQLRETVRSMRKDLSSGPAARERYDRSVESQHVEPVVAPQPQVSTSMTQAVSVTNSLADAVVSNLIPVATRFRRFLQTGWTCPACGVSGMPSDKFCTKCGAAMKESTSESPARTVARREHCESCGNVVSREAKFCNGCGAPLA